MDVLDKLQSATTEARIFGWSRPKQAFLGTVDQGSFSVQRNITYRNSFLPILNGRLERAGTSTLIHVRMSVHPLVLMSMFVWMVGMGVAFLLTAIGPALKGRFDAMCLIPLGMFLFGYGGSMWAFLAERKPAIKALEQLLSAKVVP